MAFSIRRAEATDERAIKSLVWAAKINPMGIHWQRFLVAVAATGDARGIAGRVVGIGQVKVHGDGSREVASVATVPDRQGEGIATAIIEALLAAEASQSGALYLTCRAHLEPFYERFGFRRVESSAGLPPYFRRLMRLGQVFFAAGRRFGYRGGLIMVRDGE